MKNSLLTTVAMFGLLSAMTLSGHAADLVEAPVYAPPPPPPVVVSTSGWYLRGDIGYVKAGNTSGNYDFYNILPGQEGVDNTEHYDKISLDGTAIYGGGVGYRFTDYLRTDVTADYFKADGKGSSRCGYAVEAGYNLSLIDNNCRYNDSSKASVWTLMANAYVDLGHYGRFTPYIGAGIGAAHVKYDDLHSVISCGGEACDENGVFRSTHPGESSWRFASSLMAGATVDITDHLKFDAGYRYTRIAGGDAFGFDSFDRAAGASGVQGRDHGFDVHTVRAGLRYEFGGATVGGYDDGFGFGKGKAPVYADAAPVYAEPAPVAQAPVYK